MVALLGAFLPVLPAQDKKPDAKAAYDALVAEFTAADKASRTAMQAMMQTEEWKAAVAAKDQAKINALRSAQPMVDRPAMARKALELAARYEGDGRVPFYCWAIVYSPDKDVAATAIDAILKDHVESPAVVELMEKAMVIGRQVGNEKAAEVLEAVIARNPDNQAKAWALYWSSISVTRNRESTPEQREAAKQRMAEAAKLAEGTILADRINGPEFEKTRLQIGMESPDIAGEDMDGVAFKLSDYRGKVVVLDFWGFW
jgi:hypothetical protein